MSKPSQGLRALASMLETITPELAPVARSTLAGAAPTLHQAAPPPAAPAAPPGGGAVAGPARAGEGEVRA